MVDRPPTLDDLALTGAIDARFIVPVTDEHGGVTIYYRGQPTHYLLGGEWFVARPAMATADEPSEPAEVIEGVPRALPAGEAVVDS